MRVLIVRDNPSFVTLSAAAFLRGIKPERPSQAPGHAKELCPKLTGICHFGRTTFLQPDAGIRITRSLTPASLQCASSR